MNGAGAPKGLMCAGLILSVIGLIIVVTRTLAIPRYWMPLLIGIALLVVGAVWSAASRRSRRS